MFVRLLCLIQTSRQLLSSIYISTETKTYSFLFTHFIIICYTNANAAVRCVCIKQVNMFLRFSQKNKNKLGPTLKASAWDM